MYVCMYVRTVYININVCRECYMYLNVYVQSHMNAQFEFIQINYSMYVCMYPTSLLVNVCTVCMYCMYVCMEVLYACMYCIYE